MTNRRNYPIELKKHKHHAFELVGMTYDDYLYFCKKMNLPKTVVDSKKEFFRAIFDGLLIKENDELFLKGEKL